MLALTLLLGGAAAAPPWNMPLIRGADPDAEVIDGEYWAFPTNARGGDRLVAWSSPDLKTWRERGVLLAQKDVAWIKEDRAPRHHLWAPDMVPANGRWYLYYSVGPQNPTPSRLGVAICETPAGPCRDSGRPLAAAGPGFEAIDPMVFTDPRDGTRLLYAGGSAGATLRAWRLGADMTTLGEEVKVAQPPGFTEGVFVHEREGTYYLSYSAGNWDRANYSVHYVTGPSPTGPWTYRGRLLASAGRFKGPGHHSFVRDGRSGDWLMLYHGWAGVQGDGPYTGSRYLAVTPIGYDPDGAIRLTVPLGKDAR